MTGGGTSERNEVRGKQLNFNGRLRAPLRGLESVRAVVVVIAVVAGGRCL
jgi:hypothetical protein